MINSLIVSLVLLVLLFFISIVLIYKKYVAGFIIFSVSVICIIILSIKLNDISQRMNGYFSKFNITLRYTESIGKPINVHVSGIYNKDISATNDISIINGIKCIISKPVDIHEHQNPENYGNGVISKERRHALYEAFHKYYYIDPRVLEITDSYTELSDAVGAHIRFTGLYTKKINFEDQIKAYTDYIDKSDCKYVFLATHLLDVEKIFKDKYGSRLIIRDNYRNPDKNSDWMSNKQDQYTEDINVLIDMVLLSKCKEIVGGPSNVFYAALWYNPELKFYMPDLLKVMSY